MERWKRLLTRPALRPGYSGRNRLRFFTDGDQTFRALWDDIGRAEERVWMETYVYEPDAVGRRTRRALVKAARRGCDVALIYDSQGSGSVTEEFFRPLREAGGTVVAFNPVFPWHRWRRRLMNPLHRDHRKLLVIDDRAAYTGGANVSEEYAGAGLGTNRFVDVLLRVEGPAVRALGEGFLQSLREATSAAGGRAAPASPQRRDEGTPACVLGLNARLNRNALDRLLREAVEQAQERCFVTAAYFIAPPWLRKALAQAARRGVDVQVVTAGRTDNHIARTAKRHVYGELLESGVRVYEMHDRLLHAKHLVIDDAFCYVGSYNMDRWSDVHNLEVGVAAVDRALARQLRAHHQAHRAHCRAYTLADWRGRPLGRRLRQWALYALMQV
jgi:cardiolipin synthase